MKFSIAFVLRDNVVLHSYNPVGFYTEVVIGFSFEGMKEDKVVECHYFCTEEDLQKTKEKAQLYDNTKVISMSLVEYIKSGYAYFKISDH